MITKEHRSMCCEFKGCVEGAVHKSLHKETHKTYITRARARNTRTHPQGRTHAHTHTQTRKLLSLSSYLLLPSSVSINQEFPLSPPSISSLPPLLRHPLPLFSSPPIPPNRWSGSSMAGGAAGEWVVGRGEREEWRYDGERGEVEGGIVG